MSNIGGAFVGFIIAVLAFAAIAGEWKTISADKARIKFTAIDGARTEFATAWNDSWTAEYTIGEWVSPKALYPRAGLVLVEAGSYRLFMGREGEIKKQLKSSFVFLQDKSINLHGKEKYKSTDHWRFELPGAECIALRKVFGETNIGASHGAGTKKYWGYYCDTPGWIQASGVEGPLGAISYKKAYR